MMQLIDSVMKNNAQSFMFSPQMQRETVSRSTQIVQCVQYIIILDFLHHLKSRVVSGSERMNLNRKIDNGIVVI